MINIQVFNNCGTNSYIISNKESAIIIDPGGIENVLYMDEHMADTETCKKIKLIILTHGHYDHTNGTSFLKNKFNVPILMHNEDIQLIGKKKYNLRTRTLVGMLGKSVIKEPQHIDVFTPDILIDNINFSLSKWGINATILHTPGHTKGSISLLVEEHLFSGDTFMNLFKPTEALFAENFCDLSKTINNLRQYDFLDIYPGHGKCFKLNKLLDDIRIRSLISKYNDVGVKSQL